MNSLSPTPNPSSSQAATSRTDDITSQSDLVNHAETNCDSAVRLKTSRLVMDICDRPTVPAPDSFAEGLYEQVRRGLLSVGDAQLAVQTKRELSRLSALRLIGGAL